ncbi:PA2169 family four-helix-bundle protein [Stieleria sp. TO1_6]|uniref:DUF2383 domain-containing protein n=1 Tax=Stieleria tagensis TaxID=2956795 RepID=UPI00209BAE5D|nr:DUF2383 domain-containing protein [Stieleria tagensis]MCO8120117.1 PA2169 family four-helix-bundle protein [Stieleria tagensis]
MNIQPEPHQPELCQLVHLNRDSRDFYQWARHRVSDPVLADAFEQISVQRSGQAAELQRLVGTTINVASPSTELNQLRLMWQRCKSAVVSGRKSELINSVVDAESGTRRAYESAAGNVSDAAITAILRRHITNIRTAAQHLAYMRVRQCGTPDHSTSQPIGTVDHLR